MSSINSDKTALLMRLKEGDEAAFEELYYLHSKSLLGFLIRLVKSESFAAEIVQDAFIRVWTNRENIDPEQSFHSYLFRIAENLVYDFFRKSARDKKLQIILINSSCKEYLHVEEKINRKEINLLLRNAIDSLPPKRRQVFQLIKIEERSYQEVSELLHVSTSTINDHVVKATKSIREKIGKYHMTLVSTLFFLLP